jgi:hypothetical protein
MKIEFIAEGAQDCPLILIHGRETVVVRQLAEEFRRLADGTSCRADVHDIFHRASLDEIRLTASASGWDIGVVQVSPAIFEWRLTAVSWDNAVGLLEPFWLAPSEEHTHQYLDQAGDISVIVSTDRSW